MKLNHLSIGLRLALAFALMLLLMLVIAFVGGRAVVSVNDSLKTVYEQRTVPLAHVGNINRLMQRNRVLVMDMMNDVDAAAHERADAELRANIEAVTQAWTAYTASSLSPQEQGIAQEYQALRKTYVHDGLLAARDAVRSGRMDDARRVYAEVIAPVGSKVHPLLVKLNDLQIEAARSEFERAEVLESRMLLHAALFSALGIVMGAVLALLITRSITRPMARAIEVADRVRDGDLAQPIEVSGRDETARLLGAMRDMQARLVGTVAQIRGGAENVSTASSQIASGSADLSQRTEQQASSLQETAASMEQLTVAVKNNAEAAQQAAQLAAGACSVASQGGAVIERVVATMGDISEASRRMAEIIGVIDGIAFQTNILALNASVEAARAGEQGRGFAVVAGEVRTLAQRSAAAAREIKTLIGNNVDRVEAGGSLVGEAGRTMGEIVVQVRRVSDLVGEISVCSHEQNDGITQVGAAVAQLDQVTQQNAALVEESAAAADSLREQARRLADCMAVFRLGEDAAQRDMPAPQAATLPERRASLRAADLASAKSGWSVL